MTRCLRSVCGLIPQLVWQEWLFFQCGTANSLVDQGLQTCGVKCDRAVVPLDATPQEKIHPGLVDIHLLTADEEVIAEANRAAPPTRPGPGTKQVEEAVQATIRASSSERTVEECRHNVCRSCLSCRRVSLGLCHASALSRAMWARELGVGRRLPFSLCWSFSVHFSLLCPSDVWSSVTPSLAQENSYAHMVAEHFQFRHTTIASLEHMQQLLHQNASLDGVPIPTRSSDGKVRPANRRWWASRTHRRHQGPRHIQL